jgi:hypothetical protein
VSDHSRTVLSWLPVAWVSPSGLSAIKGRSVGNREETAVPDSVPLVEASMKGRSVGNGEWVTILAGMTSTFPERANSSGHEDHDMAMTALRTAVDGSDQRRRCANAGRGFPPQPRVRIRGRAGHAR